MTITLGAKLIADDLLLPALYEEHSITIKVIDSIPAERANYRPHPVARTINELARHIVVTEKRFIDAAVDGQFSHLPVLPSQVITLEDLATWYSQIFPEGMSKLKQLSGGQLMKRFDFLGGEIQIITGLHFCLKHTIHHRGQLSTYLRATGVRVPSIYGQSYEDAEESLLLKR